MKRFFNTLTGILPHLCMILSLILITCVITDRYNRAMSFINNDITKVLLLILSILVILQSVLLIRANRKQQWEKYRKNNGRDQK